MSQAERGLFERIKFFRSNSSCEQEFQAYIEPLCIEFEQQLHYLAGTVEVLSAREQDLQQRLAEAERDKDKAHILIKKWFDLQEERKAANYQQPHSDYWAEAFGRTEQEMRECIQPKPDFTVKSAYTLTAPLPEKKDE